MVSLYAVIPLYMGVLSRACGGAFKIPGENFLFALPYALLFDNPWLSILAVVTAGIGKGTGHGGFMDLGTWTKERKPERLEFLIKPLAPKLTPYWYDFLGLGLTGVAVTLIPGLILALTGHISEGVIIIASGFLKPVAYAIGWKVKTLRIGHLEEPTAIGEFLTGVFSGLVILGVMLTFLS